MKEKIKIDLRKQEDNSYEIMIGADILKTLGKDIKNITGSKNFVIICDYNIEKLYSPAIAKSFIDQDLDVNIIGFEPGEKSKDRKTKAAIEDEMFGLDVGRDTTIIALGGGVSGDLAGFIAATYMRCIPFVQVPTSLLAMVDSSIGGKTAIDTPLGKNLIGSFYQPKKIYIDINTLKTLPKPEFSNGLAEIIKHALIKDKSFFSYLEKNIEKLKALDKKILLNTIKRSCEIKAKVVEKDEKENDYRKILNYGHTIGHAVESLSNLSLSHGNSISIGMNAAAKISEKITKLNKGSTERQNNLLKKAELELKIPKYISTQNILKKLSLDKKAENKEPRFTLLNDIGKAEINKTVSEKILKEVLEEIR